MKTDSLKWHLLSKKEIKTHQLCRKIRIGQIFQKILITEDALLSDINNKVPAKATKYPLKKENQIKY